VLTVAVTRSCWQFCMSVQLDLAAAYPGTRHSSVKGSGSTAGPQTPKGTATRRRPPNIIPCAFATDPLAIGPDDCSQSDSSRLTQPHGTLIHIKRNCVQNVRFAQPEEWNRAKLSPDQHTDGTRWKTRSPWAVSES
jgi:hypothetical protein